MADRETRRDEAWQRFVDMHDWSVRLRDDGDEERASLVVQGIVRMGERSRDEARRRGVYESPPRASWMRRGPPFGWGKQPDGWAW